MTSDSEREVKILKIIQMNIEAVQLGDIIDGQEVVTILDRQDDKFVSLFFANNDSISSVYGRIITVQI